MKIEKCSSVGSCASWAWTARRRVGGACEDAGADSKVGTSSRTNLQSPGLPLPITALTNPVGLWPWWKSAKSSLSWAPKAGKADTSSAHKQGERIDQHLTRPGFHFHLPAAKSYPRPFARLG